MIVSVSRRTDIPRFYWDDFIKALERGWVEVTNPFNQAQRRIVSLQPSAVDALVFWTRDPERILADALWLEKRGFWFYVMVTITGYPSLLEPNQPKEEALFFSLERLSQLLGKERIIWRYDPVFLSNITNYQFHQDNFSRLCMVMGNLVQRVVISLYDPYKKAQKRLQQCEAKGLEVFPLYTSEGENPQGELQELLGYFRDCAVMNGLDIRSCAEGPWMEALGIGPNACIDGDLIKRLAGCEGKVIKKDPYQRPGCRCVSSVDIGRYGTCQARCVYCYAW
ncbi:MAG TPA: DUF1848 domain-containing protein [Termitinemataceae bacterium]|uniref:DUF1848 domain-containing protein n=1 Tax=Treponema sp. J25 TaxID=2094121 RepID=UPI00104E1AAF|nr:DUF1848 domain-containing protein [Treponema sp. J25]TCW61753.1 hypothetical protein C5O22_05060 [Treponema sp. J25]HOJ97937.1 DUF1848 domain-containing protein [Termitinemataceae bacterium]HOM22184.1 DUF1848 domain-containing protein [Termitinemataceae bacterium]HPP99394.1 DUF1848 domain-containing protein [Termitinemataceae bacterium]